MVDEARARGPGVHILRPAHIGESGPMNIDAAGDRAGRWGGRGIDGDDDRRGPAGRHKLARVAQGPVAPHGVADDDVRLHPLGAGHQMRIGERAKALLPQRTGQRRDADIVALDIDAEAIEQQDERRLRRGRLRILRPGETERRDTREGADEYGGKRHAP